MRFVAILCLFLAGCQTESAHLKVEVGCLFHHVKVEMDIKNK